MKTTTTTSLLPSEYDPLALTETIVFRFSSLDLGNVWLGDKAKWDGPVSGLCYARTTLFVWLRKNGTNPFSVWPRDIKSRISH